MKQKTSEFKQCVSLNHCAFTRKMQSETEVDLGLANGLAHYSQFEAIRNTVE